MKRKRLPKLSILLAGEAVLYMIAMALTYSPSADDVCYPGWNWHTLTGPAPTSPTVQLQGVRMALPRSCPMISNSLVMSIGSGLAVLAVVLVLLTGIFGLVRITVRRLRRSAPSHRPAA
jgi:hypothetical protein